MWWLSGRRILESLPRSFEAAAKEEACAQCEYQKTSCNEAATSSASPRAAAQSARGTRRVRLASRVHTAAAAAPCPCVLLQPFPDHVNDIAENYNVDALIGSTAVDLDGETTAESETLGV